MSSYCFSIFQALYNPSPVHSAKDNRYVKDILKLIEF